MAKSRSLSKQQHDTSKKITTPSAYGSHKSMIVRTLDDGRLVLKDQLGEYITTADKLDNGLMDPKRTDGRRLEGKVLIINEEANKEITD